MVLVVVVAAVLAGSAIIAVSVNYTSGPVPIPIQVPFQAVLSDTANLPLNTSNGLCVVFEVYSDSSEANRVYTEADSLSGSGCGGITSLINISGSLIYDSSTMVLSTTIGDNSSGGCSTNNDSNLCPEDLANANGSLWVKVSASLALDGANQEVIDTFPINPTAYALQAGSANGIPGMIGIFDAACPSGWTRVTELDNKFIRGGASYNAAAGGSDTHTHTVNIKSGGSESTTAGGGEFHTNEDPRHTHAHMVIGTTDAGSTLPAYASVVFCKKQ